MENAMIDAYNVANIFDYCPISGILKWKITKGSKIKFGNEAGSIRKEVSGLSYRQVVYNNKWYFVHRIVWLYLHGVWPDNIDHIDGNGLNNAEVNLRSVTNATNQKNKRKYKTNKSGINGVYLINCRWLVNMSIQGKMTYLGTFHDFFEACCIRKSAEIRYNFHANHGRH